MPTKGFRNETLNSSIAAILGLISKIVATPQSKVPERNPSIQLCCMPGFEENISRHEVSTCPLPCKAREVISLILPSRIKPTPGFRRKHQ